MLSLIYLIFSLILAIPFFVILKGNLINLFQKPICLTLFFLLIIHGITPAFQYPQSMYRYIYFGQTYTLWAHIYSIILVMLFAMFMIIFYFIGRNYSDEPLPQLSSFSMSSKMYLLIFVALPAAYGAFFYFLKIMSMGHSTYMQDRIGFADRYGGMHLLFSRWLYVSFFVSFAGYLASDKRDKMILIWTILFGIITFGYFGYLGNRNSIFISLLTLVGIYLIITSLPHISIWKTAFSKIGLIVGLLVVGMVVMGYIREIKVGIKSSPVRAVTVTLNSAFGNHENMVWLIDNDYDLYYGKTYWAGLINIYPRVLWPEKPLGAGPILKNLVHPYSYAIGKKGISSLTTGYITEAYMNGGLIAVVLMGTLAGSLLRFISKLRLRCVGPWAISIYCYTTFTFAVSMTHNEFSGAYTRWLIDLFPLFWGWFFFEYLGSSSHADWQLEEIELLQYSRMNKEYQ